MTIYQVNALGLPSRVIYPQRAVSAGDPELAAINYLDDLFGDDSVAKIASFEVTVQDPSRATAYKYKITGIEDVRYQIEDMPQ